MWSVLRCPLAHELNSFPGFKCDQASTELNSEHHFAAFEFPEHVSFRSPIKMIFRFGFSFIVLCRSCLISSYVFFLGSMFFLSSKDSRSFCWLYAVFPFGFFNSLFKPRRVQCHQLSFCLYQIIQSKKSSTFITLLLLNL